MREVVNQLARYDTVYDLSKVSSEFQRSSEAEARISRSSKHLRVLPASNELFYKIQVYMPFHPPIYVDI
ncbi:hypothetical protein L596_021914 [Steinernema carpocapsae]|uniref:Uncharacterized protein n=1 Tax=Steinernema carpocapsae TaxID=34508 RepID=A0A4U5MK58_STECR|nr:hypothetical protein L596_021914 [Steinernema carpocapsae]